MNKVRPLRHLVNYYTRKQCKSTKSSKSKRGDTDSQEVVRKEFYKLKETQKRFQVEDGRPVYLKAGVRDTILYRTTCFMLIIALLDSVYVWYKLSFAKATFKSASAPEPE